jgi:hypothetical protein
MWPDCRLATRSAVVSACRALVFVTAAAWQYPAHAQGKLEATYSITFARISVGSAAMTVDFKENEYSIAASGRAGGMMRMLANGEASLTTHGIVKDGRPESRSFASKIVSEDESQDVTMSVEEGNVKELAVTPPPGSGGVQVSEANRQGIIDPLTAMLISAGAAGEDLSPAACQHTLPIFDGRHRYDLTLAFKRMDKVRADKGYAGPAVVCSVGYQPIAGHRASTALV